MKNVTACWSEVLVCVYMNTWHQVTRTHKLVSLDTTGKVVTTINLEATVQISELTTKMYE
jgi:hypothetical protein